MIIKLYIFTIIFFFLSFISIALRYVDYIGKKEGVKIGKIKRFLWSSACIINLRVLLIGLVPIVNIMFALFFILSPEGVLADVYDESTEKIKEE